MANITNNTIDSSSSFETSSTSMGTTTTSNVPFLYEVMTKNNQPFVKITDFPPKIDFSRMCTLINELYPGIQLTYTVHNHNKTKTVSYVLRWATTNERFPNFLTVYPLLIDTINTLQNENSNSNTDSISSNINTSPIRNKPKPVINMKAYWDTLTLGQPEKDFLFHQNKFPPGGNISVGKALERTLDIQLDTDAQPNKLIIYAPTESKLKTARNDIAEYFRVNNSALKSISQKNGNKQETTDSTIEFTLPSILISSAPRVINTISPEEYLDWDKAAKGRLIGRGGSTIQKFCTKYQCTIDANVKNPDKVKITAVSEECLQNVIEALRTFYNKISPFHIATNYMYQWSCSFSMKIFNDMKKFNITNGIIMREGFTFGKITGIKGFLKHTLQDRYQVRIQYSPKRQMITIYSIDKKRLISCSNDVRLLEYGNKYTLEISKQDMNNPMIKGTEYLSPVKHNPIYRNNTLLTSIFDSVFDQYGVYLGIYNSLHESKITEPDEDDTNDSSSGCTDSDNDSIEDTTDAEPIIDDMDEPYESSSSSSSSSSGSSESESSIMVTATTGKTMNSNTVDNFLDDISLSKQQYEDDNDIPDDATYYLIYAGHCNVNIDKGLNYFRRKIMEMTEQMSQ